MTAAIPHVMISYQWDVQERMKKLKEELTRVGFNVWMDIDKMVGNMDERMAEAVENSAAVLVCFSAKYQESGNCKKEAQYAQDRGKPIIPLKVDDHKPDNWLGLNINALLYYDVTSDEKMMNNLPKIIEALEQQGAQRRDESEEPPKKRLRSVSSTEAPKRSALQGQLKKQITEKDAGDIAAVIGTLDELNNFYADLGLKNRDIRAAEKRANSVDPTTMARNVLLKWRQINGHDATREKVLSAMKKRSWGQDCGEVGQLWK